MPSHEDDKNSCEFEEYKRKIQELENIKHKYNLEEQELKTKKEKKEKLSLVLKQLEEKLESITFFVESGLEERSQIRMALTKDKLNETLCLKMDGILVDVEKYSDSEQKQMDKIQKTLDNILLVNKSIEENFCVLLLLKDEIYEREKTLAITKRELLDEQV